MTTHKKSLGGTGLVILGALFLTLTILNAVVFRGIRLDLTENQLFTISEGTRNILTKIDEPVNLYLFYSDEAAENIPYLRTYARRVRELLQEFVLESDGRLRLTEIDPVPFSEEEDRASQYGLQAVSLGTTGDPIYFGLAGTNSIDDLEIISFFQPDRETFLEYDVAKLVYTLAKPQKPVVALLSSLPMTSGFDPATGQPRQPWVVASQIEQLFELRTLDGGLTAVDDDVDLLVLVHPKALSDQTLYAIDQFVMRGGKLMVFVDPLADAELPQDMAGASAALFQDRSSDLERLFGAWGIEYDADDVVLDQLNALTVNTGLGQPPARHLAMLGIREQDLATDDVITADLSGVNLGSAGYLGVSADSGLEMVALIQSSDSAGTVAAESLKFLPDPATLQDDFAPTGERYVMGARFAGMLTSAFPEGPPPADDEESAATPEHIAATEDPANLIVVSDTDILTDRMWVQVQNFLGQRLFNAFAGNGALVVNALDNLLGSSDLISVRSRGTYSRPFDRVEALRADADARYRAEEQSLQQKLDETERRLTELESAKDQENLLIISPEQQAELLRFQDEKLRIRKALRDVRRDLDRNIENLGTTLKIINIALVPVLLSIVVILMAMVRTRRRN
ncbi:MAG: Gldg family protein [Chromatiales bacterium]|jgi:ABC-type uncharacterized transport system involved in gliding motility auxiliary subunit|nr:Gldg family protein [Chromatiales bacterium]